MKMIVSCSPVRHQKYVHNALQMDVLSVTKCAFRNKIEIKNMKQKSLLKLVLVQKRRCSSVEGMNESWQNRKKAKALFFRKKKLNALNKIDRFYMYNMVKRNGFFNYLK